MHRRAFTLIEILICLVIISVVAALTVPFFGRDHADRAASGAALLRSDLRFAQLATMANPQDPVIVRFRSDGKGYWLARLTTPETPLVRSDTGAAWSEIMGSGRARSADHVTLATTGVSGATLRFTPLGSVHAPSGTPKVTLTAGGPGGAPASCSVTIDTSTGTSTLTVP
ncbi:MAG: type II secretion system protein [Phycisphaerae bacterium]|nr:type II secretion system protein [Phycisphaerae bacterium]